tara:strand:+ start:102 stop:743 length:642 start_codon:yes stop_codon:yes gene_type:complete
MRRPHCGRKIIISFDVTMKYFKQLLFLSIICSLVWFINCSDNDEIVSYNKVPENSTKTPLYLAENGITIKASDTAVIGESYQLGGISYLVVDSAMLYKMVANDEDVTKVVTSNVTNMKLMFDHTRFNQDIGSWDLSNVTDMNGMFDRARSFNQDIGNWDVINVTNMQFIFFGAESFNQNISSWNVSHVIDCEDFSEGATVWREPKPSFTNCTE